MVEVFPVAIGHYASPNIEDLDVETQVGRVVDLLAPFGGVHREWAHPARDRGSDAVQQRLNDWASPPADTSGGGPADRGAGFPDGVPGSSVLYWVGHGWSDGDRSALAHTYSPAVVAAAGVDPQQLAYALRSRQALLEELFEDGDDGWAMVVIDTCRSRQIVNAIIVSVRSLPRIMLVAVSSEGGTSLGRFTETLGEPSVRHTVGLRTGVLTLDLNQSMFPAI